MELQGQEDAEARVTSGACVASVDSIAKWPELLEWLERPQEPSIYIYDGDGWSEVEDKENVEDDDEESVEDEDEEDVEDEESMENGDG